MLINNTELNVVKDYVKKPKAVIVITHGIAEHLRRYDHFTKFLNDNNYSVIRYDQRGHGESSGLRGHLEDYNLYISDLQGIVKIAREDNKDKKIFLLGHSLGGISVNLYTALHNDVDGVITSGGVSGYVKQAKFLRYFYKLFQGKMKIKNKIKKASLTSDKEIETNYFKDPLVLKEFNFSLGREMLVKAVKKYLLFRKNITVPYLILHGELDKIVSPKLSINNYNNLISEDKEIKIIENAAHEILNEKNKEKTYNIIISWLDKRYK